MEKVQLEISVLLVESLEDNLGADNLWADNLEAEKVVRGNRTETEIAAQVLIQPPQ